jgi:endonuclease/exonuclease/phosphatase family metal-dependent hydrolase
VRLVSTNAASGRDRSTGAPDLERWAGAVAGLGADVVAVQEVDHLLPRSGEVDQTALLARRCAADGPPWAARFAAAVHGTPGHRDTFGPAGATADDGVTTVASYGVALLSRHPVQAWWEHRFLPSRLRLPVPLPPGAPARVLWVPDEPRVALAAQVSTPGGDLTVVCTHLSFVPTRAVRQLRELVAWAADLPRPLVLLGDLNLAGRWPARTSGWTPLVHGRTYPAGRPRAQLDHVLLDDPAGAWRAGPGWTTEVGGSDHRAAVAELEPLRG